MKVLLFICLAFLCFACKKEIPPEETYSKQEKVLEVAGYRLAYQVRTNQLERPGFVGIKKKVNVITPREEIIKSISFSEGDIVRKGNTLFTLDLTTLNIEKTKSLANIKEVEINVKIKKAQFEKSKQSVEKNLISLLRLKKEIELDQVNVENSKRVLENKKKLFSESGISGESLIEFQIKYINAKENLEIKRMNYQINSIGYRNEDILQKGYKIPKRLQEKKNLLIKINTLVDASSLQSEVVKLHNAQTEYSSISNLIYKSTVRSPINGYIAVRSFDQGEKATQAQPVFIVVNLEEVYIEANIPENYYGSFALKDPLFFTLDKNEQQVFKSVIRSINPIINPETSSFKIRGNFKNKNYKLRPGMFLKIKLLKRIPTKGLFVKKEDLIEIKFNQEQSETLGKIYLFQNGKVVEKEIELGKEWGDEYEVNAGLNLGDIIISKNKQILRNSQKVKVILP